MAYFSSHFVDQMEKFREEGTPNMVDRTMFATVPTSRVRFASVPLVFPDVDTATPLMPETPTPSSRYPRRFQTPIAYSSDSGSDYEAPGLPHPHSEGQSGGIPKPDGEAGRPGRGGYNLQATLKWPVKKWRSGFIRTSVLETLDCSLSLSDQPLLCVQAVRDQATTKFPFLNDYENVWVVDDMIHSRLKYEKTALKRKRDSRLADEARAKSKERITISIPASKKSRNA
ncbi:hypothetical protein GGU11DRAFT_845698 [Lentinula aff. detonsa]|nr:hypothetical protein GGU11DRAFT_845698 [Lentinula aff. detonsa]